MFNTGKFKINGSSFRSQNEEKKMKMIILTGLAIELLMFGAAGIASPVTVISDHFDDSTLDPAWSINFYQATGWSYTESGTTLNVTDIASTEPGWAFVSLKQDFTPLSDFNIDFWFSWDSEGSTRAMQNVLVQVYGQTGKITAAGYSDGWIPNYGAKYGEIGGTSIDTGPDSLPGSGSALVNISRTGNVIEILWDGVLLLSGASDDFVSRIELVFSYRVFDEGGISSFFGNEAIDLINVEGTIVHAHLSGWVWLPDVPDIGYSLDEGDWLYFYSSEPVWFYNINTGQWVEPEFPGWIYFDWPFFYVLNIDTLIFVLPPESGLWVYHFSTGEWEELPRILPW